MNLEVTPLTPLPNPLLSRTQQLWPNIYSQGRP